MNVASLSSRRRRWDAAVRRFVEGFTGQLIICGDLNVAPGDADLTHPDYFKVSQAAG